jgi:hypothetical protein
MKLYLGPYKTFIGPYQIADAIFFWVDRKVIYRNDDPYANHYANRWDYRACDKLGDLLADSWVGKFCYWLDEKRGSRKIKVRIDRYDTWNMDNTLALIIHPMLVQLRKSANSSGKVDDEDVPEHLRSTAVPPKENCYDIDDNYHKRWEYVLDEMIFAFEAKANGNWDDQFYSGERDINWVEVEFEGEKLREAQTGPNHTFKVDREGLNAYHARMKNGFRLFGKYYESLWD